MFNDIPESNDVEGPAVMYLPVVGLNLLFIKRQPPFFLCVLATQTAWFDTVAIEAPGCGQPLKLSGPGTDIQQLFRIWIGTIRNQFQPGGMQSCTFAFTCFNIASGRGGEL